MNRLSPNRRGRRAATASFEAAKAHLLGPWDGQKPFIPARNLERPERSGILREIVSRHTDTRGRPAAIRRIANRLGRASGTVYAWLNNTDLHPVPPVEIDLLRMDDAALHGALRADDMTAAAIRQLYEPETNEACQAPAGDAANNEQEIPHAPV